MHKKIRGRDINIERSWTIDRMTSRDREKKSKKEKEKEREAIDGDI